MDKDYNTIENIDNFIENIDQDIIIKQADYLRGGGEGVEKYIFIEDELVNFKNNKSININELKTKLKGNFIAQEVIKQHPELSKYHPSSLNTLKIYTYRSVKTNNVSVIMGALRIGMNNSFLDNVSIGGLGVGLKINSSDEAVLREYGLDQWNKLFSFHPNTKIKFKDNKIPNFTGVVESVKKLANFVPYQRLIGWDFCINHVGEPVLIELNVGSGVWGLQVTNGRPLFGDFTGEIKEYLSKI